MVMRFASCSCKIRHDLWK